MEWGGYPLHLAPSGPQRPDQTRPLGDVQAQSIRQWGEWRPGARPDLQAQRRGTLPCPGPGSGRSTAPMSTRRDFPISQTRRQRPRSKALACWGPTAHVSKEDLGPGSARSQGVSCRTPSQPSWRGAGGREGWEAEPRAFLLRKPVLALTVLIACKKVRVPWVVGEEARVRCETACASVSPVQAKEGHLTTVLP